MSHDASARTCYCIEDGGFCGTCQTCGAPGHVRHYPGSAPYSGSWCDACHAALEEGAGARIDPGQILVWALLMLPVAYVLWRVLAAVL